MSFYRFFFWLAYGLCLLFFRIRIEGHKHIPVRGGLILAGNHCSYMDPVLIGVAAWRELWYVTKAEMFSVPVVGWLIANLHAMPVRRGQGDRGAIRAQEAQLKSGGAVFVFPEGTRNKSGRFLPPKSGVGMLAYRTRVPVVPVFIFGTSRIWKCLLGLERVTIRFGSPLHVRPERLPSRPRETYGRISRRVMSRIKALKQRGRRAGTASPCPRSLRRAGAAS